VVYLSDSSGYIPLAQVRGRVPGGGGGGGGAAYGTDLENWRPELWDRDYNRRYRYNNTRVQRKFTLNFLLARTCNFTLKYTPHFLTTILFSHRYRGGMSRRLHENTNRF
jgi:hypothetical protein